MGAGCLDRLVEVIPVAGGFNRDAAIGIQRSDETGHLVGRVIDAPDRFEDVTLAVLADHGRVALVQVYANVDRRVFGNLCFIHSGPPVCPVQILPHIVTQDDALRPLWYHSERSRGIPCRWPGPDRTDAERDFSTRRRTALVEMTAGCRLPSAGGSNQLVIPRPKAEESPGQGTRSHRGGRAAPVNQ